MYQIEFCKGIRRPGIDDPLTPQQTWTYCEIPRDEVVRIRKIEGRRDTVVLCASVDGDFQGATGS